jgi:streptomycin 6-kinase
MTFPISPALRAACAARPEAAVWLERVPDAVREIGQRWSLRVGAPFEGAEGSVSWVAPVQRADGTSAVLKLGMPHFEAEQEGEGLRFWDGDPTVRLLDADSEIGALLLERCEPGNRLRELAEPEQDRVIAALLRRLWRPVAGPGRFRALSAMLERWRDEALSTIETWADEGLVRQGLGLFEELSRPSPDDVLLATDLHAGNVLGARREPWLVIDPKPFFGDRAYDATQHLLNCRGRLRSDPRGTVSRVADLLEVERERVRLWTFARFAFEACAEPGQSEAAALARALLARVGVLP